MNVQVPIKIDCSRVDARTQFSIFKESHTGNFDCGGGVISQDA